MGTGQVSGEHSSRQNAGCFGARQIVSAAHGRLAQDQGGIDKRCSSEMASISAGCEAKVRLANNGRAFKVRGARTNGAERTRAGLAPSSGFAGML